MKNAILSKLAVKSLHGQRKVFYPFTIALMILFAIEFIMLSLAQNDYLQSKRELVTHILSIGLFFVSVLVIAISIYTSSFVRKNLSKEYGLFSVLGLEKKHLVFIASLQLLLVFLVTAVFLIALGYLTGHFIFKGLNLAMQDTGTTFMEYPFEWPIVLENLAVMLVAFLGIFITWVWNIIRLDTIKLMKTDRKGEGQPKSRWLLLFVGLAMVGAGYYIALTTSSVVNALTWIFVAIALVMVGTYFLFLSLITIVLKAVQNSRIYYQKANIFISTAGMLQRIQNSALSLASIAILISGVVLVMTMTLTVYRNIEETISRTAPSDFKVEFYAPQEEASKIMMEDTLKEVESISQVTNVARTKNIFTTADFDGQELSALKPDHLKGQPVFLIMETAESYNELMGETIDLKEDEVLLTSNLINTDKINQLKISDHSFKSLPVDPKIVPVEMGIEVIYLAFANQELLDQAVAHFPTYNAQGQPMDNAYYYNLYFDVADKEDQVQERLEYLRNHPKNPDLAGMDFSSREGIASIQYETNGGVIFIGAVVSFVLLVGTILMLYYKQISEGQADRGQFEIMAKVGLPQPLIKRTIAVQLIWIFALPVLVAIIHNMVASKIVYKLLGLVGVSQPWLYASSLLLVISAFVMIYLLAYWSSSRAYYEIVQEG